MNSHRAEDKMEPATEIKPHRARGWLFVAAFFIQAIAFTYAYRDAYNKYTFASGQALIYDSAELDRSGRDALAMSQMLLVACGVVSVVCITGAIIGFRRHKLGS